jgi:hypothetical protein
MAGKTQVAIVADEHAGAVPSLIASPRLWRCRMPSRRSRPGHLRADFARARSRRERRQTTRVSGASQQRGGGSLPVPVWVQESVLRRAGSAAECGHAVSECG